MKNFSKRFGMILLATMATYAYAGMWTLVNQQFASSKWYCTYKLEGTTVLKTIESPMPCQPAIYQP